MIGLACVQTWDSDFIVRECKDIQLQVCDSLGVEPTKCIIFATSDKEEWAPLNRGNKTSRLCISHDIEQIADHIDYDQEDN